LIGTSVGNHLDVDKIANNVFTLGDTIDHFDVRGEVLHVFIEITKKKEKFFRKASVNISTICR